jgi:hypothetical protein
MADKNLAEKRNVTPEMAIKYFRENGIEIDDKLAENLLDLMYFFAKLSVDQYIKEVSDTH